MSLELIVGCMYSGKSSELMRLVNRIQSIQKHYIIYNSSLDTRYGSRGIFTHNQGHLPFFYIFIAYLNSFLGERFVSYLYLIVSSKE